MTVLPVRPAVTLSASMRSVPRSFFCRALPAAPVNALVSVSVAPGTTSMPTVAALRLKVRAVVKVSVARKPWVPEFAERRTTLAGSPRAVLLGTARMPPMTSMIEPPPPKVLAPVSSKVPLPILVKPVAAEPEMTPVSRRPAKVLELLAVDTLKTGAAPETEDSSAKLSATRN